MKAWLALPLGLLLGQTPVVTPPPAPDADTQDPAALALRDAWERALQQAEATDAGQDVTTDLTVQMDPLEVGPTLQGEPVAAGEDLVAPGIGGAGADPGLESPGTQAAAPAAAPPPAVTPGEMSRERERLRTQAQALQTQMEAQQQERAAQDALVQQQFAGMRERAQELEGLREENLELMQQAGTWLIAADEALAQGELDIGDALDEADTALEQALQNASEAGRGEALVQVEATRSFIALALDLAGQRDVYNARWALMDAALRLREARRSTLDRPDTASLLTP